MVSLPIFSLEKFFMRQQIEQRLKELRSELETGRKTLAELESKQMDLRNTLARISDTIKVLEEQLSKENC
jgi:septal ring factor EnvC (AmiA/AmiB activator)